MKLSYRLYLFLTVWLLINQQVSAQEKHTVQVKVFNEQLKPFPNIELSLNGQEFVATGKNGSAYIELHNDDLPPESVKLKDNDLEAASWNYSKGILEIIVRKKNYKVLEFLVHDLKAQPVPDTEVTFKGKTTVTTRTSSEGKFKIPVALDESVITAEKFSIANYVIRNVVRSGNKNVLVVQHAPTIVREAPVASKPAEVNQEYFRDFDLSNLDSIKSLTVFYAIFKNYHVSDLDEVVKKKLDAKLKNLVEQLDDPTNEGPNSFIGKISDSSFVSDDITHLLAQAALENRQLDQNKGDFDEKIQVIREKLETGIGNLNAETRAKLLTDLKRLEILLQENESKFYENQSHYRLILRSINENFFNYESLENRLSFVEAQRLQDQEIFRKKILTILAIVMVFAVIVVLLIAVRNKLKAQKKELVMANAEIKRINENLEDLVFQRTKLLQEANRELDLFLYKASHDLRAPLCSIIGLGNLAATNVGKDESRELFERVVQTAHSMDRLLNKLRIISEINEPGKYTNVEILPMVEGIKHHFTSFLKQNRIDVTINCPEDLQLYSNKTLTEAILFYLLENAIFFSARKKSGTPGIEFTARNAHNEIEFTIYDNGIGIDKSIRHKVFDMFFIGHEGSAGNGLGLYIVGKSVNALKGKITFDSEINCYTRFVVRIPVPARIEVQETMLLEIPGDFTKLPFPSGLS
jgi:signal transduction histidine kinase